MTIELHDRLSEFSYGYGVTREVEQLLESVGLRVTPFLPSLLDEGGKGYDVAFDKPGKPLLLQFKLGQELQRFRRPLGSATIPTPLTRPFWRYRVNVDEAQFKLLEQAETDAEVYYVAPRFSTWLEFDNAFQAGSVLSKSLLVSPSDIRSALQGQSGTHRVVYDADVRYVCSEAAELVETKPYELADKLSREIRTHRVPLARHIDELFSARVNRRADEPRFARRAEELRGKLKRNEQEIRAAVVGLEAWAHGAQLILVRDDALEAVK